jgi:hypothetical protein
MIPLKILSDDEASDLRDRVAMAAMQAIISNGSYIDELRRGVSTGLILHTKVAEAAYRYADALMEMRVRG